MPPRNVAQIANRATMVSTQAFGIFRTCRSLIDAQARAPVTANARDRCQGLVLSIRADPLIGGKVGHQFQVFGSPFVVGRPH